MADIDSTHAPDPASQALPGVASAVPETALHLRVDRLVQDAALALARGDSVAAIRLSADALASAVDSDEPALMAQARVISARVA